ncbi:MAG: hypothetical protein V1702_03260 [Candidatus Woesearchaeota archaeon]
MSENPMIYLWLTPGVYESLQSEVERHHEECGLIAARTNKPNYLATLGKDHILAQVKREKIVLPNKEIKSLEIHVAQILPGEHSRYRKGIIISDFNRERFTEEQMEALLGWHMLHPSALLQMVLSQPYVPIRTRFELEDLLKKTDETQTKVHSFVDDARTKYLRGRHSTPREKSPIFYAYPVDLVRKPNQ